MREKNSKKCPIAAVCSVLGTLLLSFVVIICIPLTVPKVLGYIPYTVISGSMEPAIPTGSLVYVRYAEPETILPEDVIAYYDSRDPAAVVTHRVVENKFSDCEFITKGDANKANDIQPVSYRNVLGRVEASIPVLGTIAQMLTAGFGKIAALSVIGLAVVLHIIGGVLSGKSGRK